MNRRALSVCFVAALAACGSEKKSATENNTVGGDDTVAPAANMSQSALTSSKMVQQASSSSQSQADQSETASSGADDGSGTSKMSPPASSPRRGSLGVHVDGGLTFPMPIANDFNVTLAFEAFEGPDAATANGNVRVHVRHGNGSSSIELVGSTTHDFGHGREIKQSTEPNFIVVKNGTRASGNVTRELTGIIRRTLTSAQNPNLDFDFYIDHHNSRVTDTYAAGSLTSRDLAGTIVVTDKAQGNIATLTFNGVKRPKPAECLCPTEGSIVAEHKHGNASSTVTHTFTGACGAVTVTEQFHVDVAANANATTSTAGNTTSGNASTSVSSGATNTAKVTWDFCSPS